MHEQADGLDYALRGVMLKSIPANGYACAAGIK
jgi:hypothetical protein